MKEALTFNDVNIVPGFSDITSRSEVDLSSIGMKLPVIAANMDTVTNEVMAHEMLRNGAQACLHRFGTIEENVKTLRSSGFNNELPMVSIGLGTSELDRAKALFEAGAFSFVIDVAHGAQLSVLQQAKYLREIVRRNASIVVGNFASGKSVEQFNNKIVDGIKVGVGPGAACTTRMKTGVGIPQFTAIQEVRAALKGTGIWIIGDGGLKTPGDIAKALGVGAHAVMIGSMFAGTDESPGELMYVEEPYINATHGICFSETGITEYVLKNKCDNKPVIQWVKLSKKYRGSASEESYKAQGKVGKHRTAEGESFLVPYKGSVVDILQDIQGGLRSAFTYVGARNLKEFHEKVEFVRVSHAGHIEGTAHKGK